MSKIGRKPILLASAQVSVDAQNVVSVKGAKATFTHQLPPFLSATIDETSVTLSSSENTRKARMLWGLNRALLANKVTGATVGFEQQVNLVGLGYKGQLTGNKIVFSIGYSHKVEYVLPEGVTVDIDKPGQKLLFKAVDKFILGNVCDAIRSIRPPEPYKGTGIMLQGEVILRKAGKTKA